MPFTKDKNIKSILLDAAQMLGYLALGIAIWETSKNAYLVIIYALLMLMLMIVLRYNYLIKKVSHLESLVNNSEDSIKDAARIKDLFEGMLSLILYITEKPSVEAKHKFTFIEEEYIVHGDDGIYNWKLKGYNPDGKPSRSLTIKYSGDSPIDVSSLSLSVIDKQNDLRFTDDQIKIITDMEYLKILRLEFPDKIEKGSKFDLIISCRWDNTFTRSRKHDYVFFAWGFYASKGVEKLVGRLVCDVPISNFVLERLEKGSLIKEIHQPKIIESKSNHYVLEWEATNPNHFYILRFTKELPNISRIEGSEE